MSDGILSQEEIDALLRGESHSDAGSGGFGTDDAELFMTDIEKDALGEIGNISMGTSATTLSTLLGKKVSITTPQVRLTTKMQLQSEYPLPYVVVEVEYREGLTGSNILVIKKEDASIIADLMMGGAGNATQELNDLTLSAVGEAMNQMMGSATTSLSSMFDMKIDISPPRLNVVDFSKEELGEKLGQEFTNMVQILFKMEIKDLLDSQIMQIIPIDSAKMMVAKLMHTVPEADVHAISESAPPPTYAPAPVSMPTPAMDMPMMNMPQMAAQPSQEMWYAAPPMMQQPEMPSSVKKGQVPVQPVQFMPLESPSVYAEPRNIDLILDVPLDLSVELGKTRKSIKEILDLGPGSIIQLDKLAGEPVDLMVNGKLIAKGEVVVIDESYGIRITAIISPMDRMSKLQ